MSGASAAISRWWWVVTVVVAVSAFVAGLSMASARTPNILATAPSVTTYEVTLQEYADTRSVLLVPDVRPVAPLVADVAGRLTRSACAPADPVISGEVTWAIDGVPLLSLHTSEPLYRELGPGDEGSDVLALEEELARLGHGPRADRSFDGSTAAAVESLRRQAGLSAGSTFTPRDVVWLPSESVVPQSCLPVGSVVQQGAELATLPPELRSARVDPMPEGQVVGDRVVAVSGLVLPVSDAGELSAEGMQDLAAWPGLPAALEALQAGGPAIDGRLSLAEPVPAATIPASAVIVADGQACVFDGGEPLAVTVVSSQVGQSVVQFEGKVPAEVELDPGADARCG